MNIMSVIFNFLYFLLFLGILIFGIKVGNQLFVKYLKDKEAQFKETQPKLYIMFDRIRIFLRFIYVAIILIIITLYLFIWSIIDFLPTYLILFFLNFLFYGFLVLSLVGLSRKYFFQNLVGYKDYNDAMMITGERIKLTPFADYWKEVVIPYSVNKIRKMFNIQDIQANPAIINNKMTFLSSVLVEENGREKRYVDMPFSINMSDLSKHVYILAPTGSGKTKSIIGPMIQQTIANGLGLVLVDPKGDVSVMNAIAGLMQQQNRLKKLKVVDLDEVNVKYSSTYNPIATCSPTTVSLMINATLYDPGSTATYYIEKQKEFVNAMMGYVNKLMETVKELKAEGLKLNFLDLYALVAYLPYSIDMLSEVIITPKTKDNVYGLWKEAIKTEATNQKYVDTLSGLRNHLAQYAFLKNAHWVINDYNPDINIEKDLNEGNTLGFFLRALSYVHEAGKLGKMILMDIQAYAAKKQAMLNKKPIPDLLFIDEASSILPDDFLKMFDMARESGIGIVVAHQDKSQFEEEFLKRMFNNTSTRVLLRAGDRETAEFFSDLVGKKKYYEYGMSVTSTSKLNGIGEYIKPRYSDNASMAEDYIIRPEKLVNDMPMGTAFIHSIRGKGAFAIRGKTSYFAENFDNLKINELFKENPKQESYWRGGLNFLKYCNENAERLKLEQQKKTEKEGGPNNPKTNNENNQNEKNIVTEQSKQENNNNMAKSYKDGAEKCMNT
ncbi:IncF plasmid conjugative transfer protein TraD [Desulfurella amilsii]|uniref:IncF plasmid conjugative transfer protein TraD n=2 Tax=Desulfurella amilsii TaxID=1562698 RepID=A0A1X4XY94_9BACT|nr:IncF plasmid conjugative transfer protein TraD [Desulfurella amilsii]